MLIGHTGLHPSLPGAPRFELPIDAVTQTFAILAKKGAGKSYTASVMAEEMLKAGQPIIVLDPTGAWWGLRSEYPVVIVGGEHADIPLDQAAGEILARSIVQRRFSAVLDLNGLRKGEARRFVTDFLECLYRTNKEAVHLFVDEADDIAPQRPFGDEAKMLGAIEDVVKRGRRKGIGCTLITQRPADLAKQVLTQCEVLVALRIVHPRDIKAVMEWVNVHGDPAVAKEMTASLPSLPIGTAWFWSPGWGNFFERVKVRRRETFDSGATPKAGEVARKPKKLAALDIAKLGEEIRSIADKAAEDNPAALRKRIAELERKLATPAPTPQPARIQRVEVPIIPKEDIATLESIIRKINAFAWGEFRDVVNEMGQRFERLRASVQSRSAWFAPGPGTSAAGDDVTLVCGGGGSGTVSTGSGSGPSPTETALGGNSGLRRMLIALAQRPGLTKRQLGLRAGLASGGGSFRTYLSKLRGAGWIREDGDRAFITPDGEKMLGTYEPLPEGRALLDYWMRELGGGAARMLGVLAESFPAYLTPDDLSARAEIRGGSFRTYLSKLRTLELIEGRGSIRASEELCT